MLSVSGEVYEDARDLMAACREAVLDLQGAQRSIDRMRDAEDLHAVVYDKPHVSGAAKVDQYGPTDARLDFERRIAPRMEDDGRLVSACADILLGRDGERGGLIRLHRRGAEVCLYRDVCGFAWGEVAEIMDMSARRCQELAGAAMDVLDEVGVDAAIAGRGAAEG